MNNKENLIRKPLLHWVLALSPAIATLLVPVFGSDYVAFKSTISSLTFMIILLISLSFLFFIYLITSQKEKKSKALSQLTYEQEKIWTTLHNINNGIITTDSEGIINFINPTAEHITGFSKDESINKPLHSIFRTWNGTLNQPEEINVQSLSQSTESQLIMQKTQLEAKDGTKKEVANLVTKITDSQNRFIGTLMIFQDVSTSSQAEQVFLENVTIYKNIYQQTEKPMILIKQGKLIDCNSKASALFECSREHLIGTSLFNFIYTGVQSNEYSESILNNKIKLALSGEPQFFQWLFVRPNGTLFRTEVNLKQFECSDKEVLQINLFNATEEHKSGKPDEHHHDCDTLTGLPNRKLFYEHLNTAVKKADLDEIKMSILFIDLDLFKNINDTLGHNIGDSLLQQTATRLQSILDANAIAARMGGDEFAILIYAVESKDEATQTAVKILHVLSQAFNISNYELFISASIGIAMYPEHGKETHSLLKNAASAMYKVKESGRNNYQVYSHEMNEKTLQKFTMQKCLRRAIEKDELLLHYQPKVDGKSGQVVGMEALVRWQHPERGLVYPADFIPLAEETGLIKPLDEWVLRTACRQLKQWQAAGYTSLRLAVNLSAWRFKEQHLPETVAQVLTETGINPSFLELEITETVAMENLNFTINTLSKLMDMGVKISIDDFGTGYSSLNYLKHFPINFLKIDRSFIADILDDKNTYAIVKAIIEVAHTLNLKVIAEGVETQEQLTLLQEMGCDEIQGYYISRPLPVEEAEKCISTKA